MGVVVEQIKHFILFFSAKDRCQTQRDAWGILYSLPTRYSLQDKREGEVEIELLFKTYNTTIL